MISWAYIKLEHSKFLLNSEFDRNTVSGMGPGRLSFGSLLLVGFSCHNDDTLRYFVLVSVNTFVDYDLNISYNFMLYIN